MSTSLLEMNHIKKEFDGLQVLKDVSAFSDFIYFVYISR